MYNTKKRLVIKNRARFTVFMILAIVVFYMLAFATINPSKTNADISHKTELVYVAPGDTLWEIANTYCDEDTDVREFIYKIKKLNNLKNSNLIVGQSFEVPID